MVIDYNKYVAYVWENDFYDKTYTAPADGVFMFTMFTNWSNALVPGIKWHINGQTVGLRYEYGIDYNFEMVVVKKGDKLTFSGSTWVAANPGSDGIQAGNNFYPMVFFYYK